MRRLAQDAAKDWSFILGMGVLVVVLLALGYALTIAFGGDPTSTYFGEVFAGLVGVAIGVPIAVRLAVLDQRREKTEERDADDRRRGEVIDLITRDLRCTRQELVFRMADRSRSVVPFLGTGLYASLRASGDLRLIDPTTLTRMSRAYDRIGLTAFLEQSWWEVRMNPASRMATDPPLRIIEEAGGYVIDQDRHTKAAIDRALLHITRLDPNTPEGDVQVADCP